MVAARCADLLSDMMALSPVALSDPPASGRLPLAETLALLRRAVFPLALRLGRYVSSGPAVVAVCVCRR